MSSIDFLSDFAAPAASPAAPGGGTPGILRDSTGGLAFLGSLFEGQKKVTKVRERMLSWRKVCRWLLIS
jgi:hypothetical protein